MPKIDYSKIVMYLVRCKDFNVKKNYVYYTTDFKSAKYRHRRDYRKTDLKSVEFQDMYNLMQKNGGFENFDIQIIESFPCSDVYDAEDRQTELKREYNKNAEKIQAISRLRAVNILILSPSTKLSYDDRNSFLKWISCIINVHEQLPKNKFMKRILSKK